MRETSSRQLTALDEPYSTIAARKPPYDGSAVLHRAHIIRALQQRTSLGGTNIPFSMRPLMGLVAMR